MSLYIDFTEFLYNPITTGIQRIAGELCRYLPPGGAVPVRFANGKYVAFPPALVSAIARYFQDRREPQAFADIRTLGAPERGIPIQLSASDIVLVPEVVIDLPRLQYLGNLSDEQIRQFRFIVYDLLPVTHPEFFWSDWLLQICRYYNILRRSTNPAFISAETQDVFCRRYKRGSESDGVVLPLGSDALGSKAERPLLNRPPTFSVLGTVEPRKNHKLILEAFKPLLKEVDGLNLRFIGRMGWIDDDFSQQVQALADDVDSGFHFEDACGDAAIRSFIEQSRATVYVSFAEGFGLPPVESLWVGTPVIASRTIPSLKDRGEQGIHFIDELDPENLRTAVLAFLDNEYSNRKSMEAAAVNLPTWESFVRQVFHWCAN